MLDLFTLANLYSLVSLTVMLLILDIDNVIFMSILSFSLPHELRNKARKAGLVISMVVKGLLVWGVGYLTQVETELFSLFNTNFSVNDCILLGGGLFLMTKSTMEIHKKVEREESDEPIAYSSFFQVLIQIALLNSIFSVDSVVTAIGMVSDVRIMITGMFISIILMYIFQKTISEFVSKHPTMKILALSFLLLIGLLLVIEAIHVGGISKGYINFAMSFSLFVEFLNMRFRKKIQKKNNVF